MRKNILVILAVLFANSVLFCTTPLTKGSIVRQQAVQNTPQILRTDAGTRDIDTYPWTENFEDPTFPPEGWYIYNEDGQGDQWSTNTSLNHNPDGERSAVHRHLNSSITEDGWLVSPLMDIPEGSTMTLSFWSYNMNPGNYGTSTVLVSAASPYPVDEEFVGVWSPVTVSDNWVYNMVDLSPWAGLSIYIAFRYEGIETYEWYLDDVMVREHSGVDSFPWEESFESGVFPPYYWTEYDMDGFGMSWDWNQAENHSQDGLCSAMHLNDNDYPEQDGWLVTPKIHIPVGSAYSLSFWSKNVNPENHGNNSVMISAGSQDPDSWDYENVWSPITVNGEWSRSVVDITPWADQDVWIAFRYEGFYSHDWYLDDVKIEEYQGNSEYPFVETFESGIFPPYYWTTYDQDDNGYSWDWNISENHSDNGNCSAMHYIDNDAPDEDGWLVTPLMRIPEDVTFTISFWSKNDNLGSYPNYGVWLSTGSPDPNDWDYGQLWAPEFLNEDWALTTIPLSDRAGQNVFIAFRYQGTGTPDWYLDDVIFDIQTIDLSPPIISHLPLINTPRDDIPYGIYVDAVDDPVFQSGISSVYLHYYLNQEDEIIVPMLQQGVGYYAGIPAQPLGTRIDYFIAATDASPQENTQSTPTYVFEVDDPVCLFYYDASVYSNWCAMKAEWGLGVLFENPLYGTGTSLHVNSVAGMVFNEDTMNLRIYSADNNGLGNLNPLMEPLEVSYLASTWTETPVSNVDISSQYFYITYKNINAENFFGFSRDRYYPQRNFFIWDGGYADFSNYGLYAVWNVSVYVQSGSELLSAPTMSIIKGVSGPELHWTEVPGADYYNLYSSTNPNAPNPWSLFATTTALEWGNLGSAACNFFKVASAKNNPAKGAAATMPGKHIIGSPSKILLAVPTRVIKPE